MRMIKVGDKYLGLVDHQRDAIRFGADRSVVVQASGALNVAVVDHGSVGASRVVKLKTRADHTGDAMRGLADDVNNG